MREWRGARAIQQVLPMVHAEEVAALAQRFGTPIRQSHRIQADEYIYSYRWRKESDRRAEVVFAIEDGCRGVWVHTKPHYPDGIFRLPSGGVHWDEAVEDALLREVEEETGLSVCVERFIALIEYHFYRGDSTVMFVSYVFHLTSSGGRPIIQESEPISEFCSVPPCQLAQLAADLRNLNGSRRGWGQWRALAHEVVYDYLNS